MKTVKFNTKLNNALGNIDDKFIAEAAGESGQGSRFKARYLLIPSAAAVAAGVILAAGHFMGGAPQRGVSLVEGSGDMPSDGTLSELIKATADSAGASSETETTPVAAENNDIQAVLHEVPQDYALPAPAEYTPDLSVYRSKTGTTNGAEIAMPEGTPIYAASDGEVTWAAYYSGFGYCCEIKLDDGNLVRYGHLSEFAVQSGDRVSRGDIIGYSGKTGMTVDPSLFVCLYYPDEAEIKQLITLEEVFLHKWNTMTDSEISDVTALYNTEYSEEFGIYTAELRDGSGRMIMQVGEDGSEILSLKYYDYDTAMVINLRGEDGYIEQEIERISERKASVERAYDSFAQLGLNDIDSMEIHYSWYSYPDDLHYCFINSFSENNVSTDGYIAPIAGASHWYNGEQHDYTAECLREQRRLYSYQGGGERVGLLPVTCGENNTVLAAGDGEVVYTGDFPLRGNIVRIKHDDGLESWYCRVDTSVSVGDRVSQGDVIGTADDLFTAFLLTEDEVEDMLIYAEDYLTRYAFGGSSTLCEGDRLTVDELNALGNSSRDRSELALYSHSEFDAADVWSFSLEDGLKLEVSENYYRIVMQLDCGDGVAYAYYYR
ncbi:MAG: M23 family metallopeptidase [Oscillospiraceae bacterium]